MRIDIIKENGFWKYRIGCRIEREVNGFPGLERGPWAVKEQLRKRILEDDSLSCGVIAGDDLYMWLVSKY